MVNEDEMDRISREVYAPYCVACNRELAKAGKAPERPEMCPRCFAHWGHRNPHGSSEILRFMTGEKPILKRE